MHENFKGESDDILDITKEDFLELSRKEVSFFLKSHKIELLLIFDFFPSSWN